MPLHTLAVAAQLTGSAVLALLFLPLGRHDRRSYLRIWVWAWVAQALAGVVLLVLDPSWSAAPFVRALHLWLAGAHGILVLAAAQSYARGGSLSRTHATGVVLVGVLAIAGALLASPSAPMIGREMFLLGGLYLLAAAILWPLRDASTVGLTVTIAALASVGVLDVIHGFISLGVFGPAATFAATAPVQVFLLQGVAAFAVALTVLDGAQFALSATGVELAQAQQRLRTLAQTDPLTGSFTRGVFRELVDDLRVDGMIQAGTVLLIDVDHLKRINAREGPAAGDAVIRGVADAIRTRTRASDLVVRWGSDEFVVVLPGASFVEGEARRAQISAAVAEVGLAATAGIAAYGPAKDIVEAVAEAERSLQARKAERAPE